MSYELILPLFDNSCKISYDRFKSFLLGFFNLMVFKIFESSTYMPRHSAISSSMTGFSLNSWMRPFLTTANPVSSLLYLLVAIVANVLLSLWNRYITLMSIGQRLSKIGRASCRERV